MNAKQPKKPYATPKLTTHGDVKTLTQKSDNGKGKGQGKDKKSPPGLGSGLFGHS